MPYPLLSTGRSILLLSACGLSVGCGSLSHRTGDRDDAALDTIASAKDGEAVTPAPSRRPWSRPETAEDADSSERQVALTSAQEAADDSRDSVPDTASRPAIDPPVTPEVATISQVAHAPGAVEEIGASRFETEVLQSDRPVLVDFYADWCGPCKQLTPMLDGLAADTPDVKIVKVNIDESRKLATAYQVRTVPTLILFRQGEVVSHHQGAASRKTLEKLLAH